MEGSKRRGRPGRHNEEITHKLDLLQEPPNSSQISDGRWTYHNPVDLNPNATAIRITVPQSDDEFTNLYGAVLVLTISVINADGSDLDNDTSNVTVYQAYHGDMLFQFTQLRVNNKATECIDIYGVLWYIRNLLGMMPTAKRKRLECGGGLRTARGVDNSTGVAAETERKMSMFKNTGPAVKV